LTEVLTDSINNLSTTIRESNAGISVTFKEPLYVMGDKTSLVRLFQNLIINAIKFHAPEETLKVQIGIKNYNDSSYPDYWTVSAAVSNSNPEKTREAPFMCVFRKPLNGANLLKIRD
jgi:light-regulated signal transduction histidine kinase (bacteriophytochrome)